jgi:hypothetical protein
MKDCICSQQLAMQIELLNKCACQLKTEVSKVQSIFNFRFGGEFAMNAVLAPLMPGDLVSLPHDAMNATGQVFGIEEDTVWLLDTVRDVLYQTHEANIHGVSSDHYLGLYEKEIPLTKISLPDSDFFSGYKSEALNRMRIQTIARIKQL